MLFAKKEARYSRLFFFYKLHFAPNNHLPSTKSATKFRASFSFVIASVSFTSAPAFSTSSIAL